MGVDCSVSVFRIRIPSPPSNALPCAALLLFIYFVIIVIYSLVCLLLCTNSFICLFHIKASSLPCAVERIIRGLGLRGLGIVIMGSGLRGWGALPKPIIIIHPNPLTLDQV